VGAAVYYVGSHPGQLANIADAIAFWQGQAPKDAVIEITESGVYAESLEIILKAGQTLKLRASSRVRPIVRLLDLKVAAPNSLNITGETGSWFSLEGILITGRGVQVDGDLAGVSIQHSTLVPGWGLQCNCDPTRPSEPSLVIGGNVGCLRIENSITGAIQINRDEVETDPIVVRIIGSIIDATSATRVAIGAPERLCAHAVLAVVRSTVLGQIQTHGIDLADDSILLGVALACRRQQGCIRFCYVTPGSKTPRRYQCQPDLVEQAVRDRFTNGHLTPQERDTLITTERIRVEPDFNSTRYGTPSYYQLADSCATEISAGADDESEMGVYHDLFQPQRSANLRARLDEYTPAGASAGIFLVT
jgi:hypothetical protein